jgi:adenylate cyclase
VSGRIDAGSSWQLGVLAAHALLSAGRLAQENDTADAVLWATGSVRPVDLTVAAVSHVPEKFANSLERLKQERAAGRRVLLALPAANAAEVPPALAAELSALGFESVALAHVQPLFDALAMQLPDSSGKVAAKSAGGPPQLPPPVPPTAVRAVVPRRRWIVPTVAAAMVLAVAGTAAVLFKHRGGQDSKATSWLHLTFQPKVAAPTRTALVPEEVPFISSQDRERIRNEYMTAPNYKALATSVVRAAFVSGQPTQDAADRAAMEHCERLSTSMPKSDPACDLYASGNVVVTRRGRPPMPREPWLVRNPAIERPFVAAQVPLASQSSTDQLNKSYPVAARAKAVVISPSLHWWMTPGQFSHDDAVRRSLERCGYINGVACTVVAVDDTFVIPIPTLVKVVGFYRPEGLGGIAPAVRDEVARRLAEAPNAWNAIAVGAAANVGIAINAASEQGAIDGALADCSKRDRLCHIVVLGPFLVEAADRSLVREQTPPPPPPPPAANVPLVADLVPFVSTSDKQRIRNEYMPAPDYKAVAISFTRMALIVGQPSQEAADRSAMEACEKLDATSDRSDRVCDLYASGNVVVTRHSRPPMPATPWLIRNRAVEQPFSAAQIPMLDAAERERIANGYPRATSSKVFVMSANRRWVYTGGHPEPNEAMRRGLERCGSIASSACMVVAIDNTFVIPVPTLTKVVGFYRPEALTGVTPQARDEVVRRLASAPPNAWNAVAAGASGNAGIALAADSEQSALDGALADCGRRDRDCRIAVMGPFLVEPAGREEKRAASP